MMLVTEIAVTAQWY